MWPVALAALFACRNASAIEHDKPLGEPYALAGRRVVFTSWKFVRPGEWFWKGNDGKYNMAGDAKYGPYDATFRAIEIPTGIRLAAEPARRVGPILKGEERPWETMGISVHTLMFDQGKYRLWGACQAEPGDRYVCYLESTDCQTWTRPSLGQIEFQGSRDNNLVLVGNNPTVFKDPNGPADERYKAMWQTECTAAQFAQLRDRRPWSQFAYHGDSRPVYCVRAAVSPDGIKWTELPDPISFETSDTHIVCYFDPQLHKYVLYTRSYVIGPRAESRPASEAQRSSFLPRRAIGRSESDNFRAFPLSQAIIEPTSDMAPSDTYYTNCRTVIPGAPDHYLMFPAIYHQASDTTSISLFSSDDGRLWSRAPGPLMLTTSEFGQWDGGCVFTTPEMIELASGDWAVPYSGYTYPHKYPRGAWKYATGLAVWPKGRLMALVADGKGEFSTAAVIAPGKRLLINAVTERAGSILVEAVDLNGKVIAGRGFNEAVPLVGDQFWTPVTWKQQEDLGIAPGEPVAFRFRLDKARIYGLEFK